MIIPLVLLALILPSKALADCSMLVELALPFAKPSPPIPITSVRNLLAPSRETIPEDTRFAAFVSELRGLRSSADIVTEGRLRQIKTLFYPTPGFDSGVSELFSGADLIIALDQNPFLSPGRFLNPRSRLEPVRPFGRIGYVHQAFDIPQRSGQFADYIVSNLLSVNENHRIREVLAFKVEGDAESIHGLVTFDSGPNTLVRKYLHVNLQIPDKVSSEEFLTAWWMRLFPMKKLGLLYKGSAGTQHSQIREILERLVDKSSGGLFVSSRDELTRRYRQPGKRILRAKPKRGDLEVVNPYLKKHEAIEIYQPFGYGRELILIPIPE